MHTAVTSEGGNWQRRVGLLLLALALLAGFALRWSTYYARNTSEPGQATNEGNSLFQFRDIRPTLIGGPDAYYHLRRAQLAAAGTDLTRDNWTNFPAGSDIHWPQGYARLLGLVYRADNLAMLKAIPVAAGLLALLVVLPLLIRRYGDLAWYPLLVLALAPAAVFPTVYAAIDHHCAEILFSLLALAGLAAGGKTGALTMAAALAGAWLSAPSWPFVAALLVAGSAARHLPARPALAMLLLIAAALLAGSLSYLADPWLGAVAEAQPLLSAGTFFRAIVALSPGFLMLPVAVLWWWRARQDGAAAGLLAMTMLALPLTLVEARFTIFLILPAAAALLETLRWLQQRGARRAAPVMALLCLLPLGRGLAELNEWSQDMPGAAETARWLQQFLPPAGDPLQPLSPPAYGVAARWDWGHHLLALGGMPVAANPFHLNRSGRDLTHRIFFSDPATATTLADSNRIRCLVLDDFAANGYADHYRDAGNVPLYQSLWFRLYDEGATTLGWRRREIISTDGIVVQVWTREQGDRPGMPPAT